MDRHKEGRSKSGFSSATNCFRASRNLAALVKQGYQINKRKTTWRIDEYMNH